MKRILLLGGGLILFLFGFKYLDSTCFTQNNTANNSVYTVSLKTKTVSFKITGMACPDCAEAIEKNLKSEKGILSSDIKFKNNVNTVTYDPLKTSTANIIKTIQKAGYKAEKTDDKPSKIKADNSVCSDCQ